MFCLFMRRWCFRCAIHLNKHEARCVVLLLHDVEPRDSLLFNAFLRVSKRSLLKCVYRIGFNLDLHMYDKHCHGVQRAPEESKTVVRE